MQISISRKASTVQSVIRTSIGTGIALALFISGGANPAFAALTFDSNNITSDGNLTITVPSTGPTGAAASLTLAGGVASNFVVGSGITTGSLTMAAALTTGTFALGNAAWTGGMTVTTGAATTTGWAYVANSLTSGTGHSISTTAQTTGTSLSITGGGANLLAGGELLDLQMGAATAGNGLNVTTTGAYTGTGLVTLTANTATTGTLQAISGTSLTTGTGLSITTGAQTAGNALTVAAGASVFTTGSAVDISGSGAYATDADAGLLAITATGIATDGY
ncbi:MAG: hypothetical protein AAB855_01115, partial [Patescibacteria group bacterium]